MAVAITTATEVLLVVLVMGQVKKDTNQNHLGNKGGYKVKPLVIQSWDELSKCQSDTHYLEIDVEMESGWVRSKTDSDDEMYLSTHTFYGSNYQSSSELLPSKGFNVQLDNWDK